MVLIVEDDLINKITKACGVCFTEDEAIKIIDEKNRNEGIGSKKRYFLIPEENRAFDVICNNKAMELTLDDLRATTNISSLEEVTEEEYASLLKYSRVN